jgi:hypothetical protein
LETLRLSEINLIKGDQLKFRGGKFSLLHIEQTTAQPFKMSFFGAKDPDNIWDAAQTGDVERVLAALDNNKYKIDDKGKLSM